MAKRKRKQHTGRATRAAVSVGTALGSIANKFDTWLAERDDIAQELTSVIGRAQRMLSSIGTAATRQADQAVALLPAARKAAKKAGRKISAKARKGMSGAQGKRSSTNRRKATKR